MNKKIQSRVLKEPIGFTIVVGNDKTDVEYYYSEMDMLKKMSFKEKIGYILSVIFPFPPFKWKLCKGLP